jgi:hypothetical protein
VSDPEAPRKPVGRDAIRDQLARKVAEQGELLAQVRWIVSGWLLPGASDSAACMARLVHVLDESGRDALTGDSPCPQPP